MLFELFILALLKSVLFLTVLAMRQSNYKYLRHK